MRSLRWLLILPLLNATLLAYAQGPGFRCGAGRDLTVQALEGISASSPAAEVTRANDLLKRAAQMCSSLGDAWYYRSVMEHRLGNDRAAAFALDRARIVGSEAMDGGINPFQLATPTAPQAPSTGGTRWALVIGIGKFTDQPLNTLRYAADDARLLAGVLQDPAIGRFPPDHVHLLLDAEATTRNIKAGLNWIARQAKPEDLVVVYVATHGSARDLDSVGGINYLITADTEGGSSEDQDALFATALPVIDLVNTVATRIRAERTAIFLDACYSGSAHAGAASAHAHSLDARTLGQFGQGSGRIIISAAREDQQSNESTQLSHGVFTYFLAQALRTRNGALPLSTVFADVHRDVMTQVSTELKRFHITQEPVLSRSSPTTDFALGNGPATLAGTGPNP